MQQFENKHNMSNTRMTSKKHDLQLKRPKKLIQLTEQANLFPGKRNKRKHVEVGYSRNRQG